MSSTPRVVVVTRPTEFDSLLERHGTVDQAAFFLKSRGRTLTDVWYRRSVDGGLSWEPELKVTSASTDETDADASRNQYGQYNGLAVHGCGVWPATKKPAACSAVFYCVPTH